MNSAPINGYALSPNLMGFASAMHEAQENWHMDLGELVQSLLVPTKSEGEGHKALTDHGIWLPYIFHISNGGNLLVVIENPFGIVLDYGTIAPRGWNDIISVDLNPPEKKDIVLPGQETTLQRLGELVASFMGLDGKCDPAKILVKLPDSEIYAGVRMIVNEQNVSLLADGKNAYHIKKE